MPRNQLKMFASIKWGRAKSSYLFAGGSCGICVQLRVEAYEDVSDEANEAVKDASNIE